MTEELGFRERIKSMIKKINKNKNKIHGLTWRRECLVWFVAAVAVLFFLLVLDLS